MRSGDEEERLQAFNLLVVSHSSVEPFSMPELVLMKEFVERNLALPSPAGRQVLEFNFTPRLLCRLTWNNVNTATPTTNKSDLLRRDRHFTAVFAGFGLLPLTTNFPDADFFPSSVDL